MMMTTMMMTMMMMMTTIRGARIMQGEVVILNYKKTRGFTLSEVLVSGILLVIIFGLVFQMLIPAKKFWLLGDKRSEVQINARIAFEKMSRDLQSSNFDSITILSGSTPAISMLSPYNTSDSITVNTDGTLMWQKYIIYYNNFIYS